MRRRRRERGIKGLEMMLGKTCYDQRQQSLDPGSLT
jgi:hypothetical protein